MVSSLDITISGHKDVTDDSSNSTSSSDTEDDVSIGNKTENNNHQTGEAEKVIIDIISVPLWIEIRIILIPNLKLRQKLILEIHHKSHGKSQTL